MSDPKPIEKPPVNWPTLLFILGTTAGALAWPLYAYWYGVTAFQICLAVVYYFATGMSITVGYHRLIAHRTFQCAPWVKVVLLVTGAAAWQGSALEWAAEHVQHHAHIDTERDPYNIKRGFWYAHVGWLVRKRDLPKELVPNYLKADRLVVVQDEVYVPLAIVVSFVVPLLLAGVGGLLLAGAVRVVAVHHTTWLINSWAHTGTKRPYNPIVSAVDNWLLALFTFGEGWHNYHHAFPGDYRNGVGRLDWDPSKWTIWLLARVGAAWGLKRISPTLQWRRRIDALIAFEGDQHDKSRMVRRARMALESRIRKTEVRLSALASRFHELQVARVEDFGELRERLARAMTEWKATLDRKKLVHARKAQELVEHLAAYRLLLERIVAHEMAMASALPA